ncbi:hypothetical protein ACO0LF_14800 [Undibacterium sp. Di27W]|uniref:hypothetical protein n=1 Tax=Undibacterium sp. Di27W TaxID=3413036 RepID=UPI003BF3C790
MGFLLPWGKLPGWLLGLLLAIFGAYLLLQVDADSWQQAFRVLMIFVGLLKVIQGIWNFFNDNAADANLKRPRKLKDSGDGPDFNSYNEAQLTQILGRIDAEHYPDRVKIIQTRLAELLHQDKGAERQ